MFLTIASVVGIVGVIGSLMFSGLQTRLLARQTAIQNSIARASTVSAQSAMMQTLMMLFASSPELRDYFYGDLPCPKDDPLRGRVVSVSEAMADVLSTALSTSEAIRDASAWTACRDYAKHLLRHSPTLLMVVTEHPLWWPDVTAIVKELQLAPLLPATQLTVSRSA